MTSLPASEGRPGRRRLTPERLERWVYAGLVVVASIAFAVLLVANIRTNQHLHRQQQRLARLTQALCRSVSDQRVTGNDQVRIPLRQALLGAASLYQNEALRQRSPISRGVYLDFSQRFDRLAQRVTIQRGIPCEFTEAAG